MENPAALPREDRCVLNSDVYNNQPPFESTIDKFKNDISFKHPIWYAPTSNTQEYNINLSFLHKPQCGSSESQTLEPHPHYPSICHLWTQIQGEVASTPWISAMLHSTCLNALSVGGAAVGWQPTSSTYDCNPPPQLD